MSQHLRTTVWIPTLLSASFALLNPLLEAMQKELTRPYKYGSYAVALLLGIWAVYLGLKPSVPQPRGRGGHGGTGESSDQAKAVGGDGGDSTGGVGGNGGNAKASGKGSSARGGKGGTA